MNTTTTPRRRFVRKALVRTLPALAVALAAGSAAAPGAPTAFGAAADARGYPWPLRPFDTPHAVRAVVGDPRTTFLHAVRGNALAGSGLFSFHDGLDIDAPQGSRIYPVVSGTVQSVRKAGSASGTYSIVVRAQDGRSFVYTHLAPAVRAGQSVTARRTILGRVENWAEELHFTEISPSGAIVNALLPGHLTPYRDSTRPVVAGLIVRRGGTTVAPFALRGRVKFIAEAYDLPAAVRDASVPLTRFARDGFGVTPAAVTWSLRSLRGRLIVPPTTAVDFRRSLPGRTLFWSVYARGTYQNRAPIVPRYHQEMPGRYLFLLTSALDTGKLRDGVYVVDLTATDARGNEGTLTTRIEIRNGDPTV